MAMGPGVEMLQIHCLHASIFLPGHKSSDDALWVSYPNSVHMNSHAINVYQKVGINANAKLAFKGRICSSDSFFRLHQRQCQSSSSLRSRCSNLPVQH